MRELTEQEKAVLEKKLEEFEKETREHIHEIEENADPKPGILRAPWWAWVLVAVAVVVVWQIIAYVEKLVLSRG